jgi:uncharacterized membrane protein
MSKATQLGRIFFATSMVAFGLQNFIASDFLPKLAPMPDWMPGRIALVYLVGILFVAAGTCIVTDLRARLAAALMGLVWALWTFLLHLPKLVASPYDGGQWTITFEALSVCGTALVLAGLLPAHRQSRWDGLVTKASLVGRYLLAVSMPVFGIQHFIYAQFVADFVPSWIPARSFWAYFTGVAHTAAGVGIAANITSRLAAMLWGVMVGLWVLMLHIPRVVAQPRDRSEWTSLFLALALSGGGFLIAGSLSKEDPIDDAE